MVTVLVQNTYMIYNIMQNRNVWIEWLWSQVSISFSEPCLNSQGLNPGRRRLWQVLHHLWTAASTSNLSSLLIQPSTDRNISLCSWREERLVSHILHYIYTIHYSLLFTTTHHYSPLFTTIHYSPLYTIHHYSPLYTTHHYTLFTTTHHYSPLFTTSQHHSPLYTIHHYTLFTTTHHYTLFTTIHPYSPLE